MTGWQTLLYKEVLRFWKVGFQTVAAPVLTALLYLLIFGHVLSDRVKVYDQISYTSFLVPGLVMMSVLQNSFANTSSSLIQSKITGNLVFLLVTPLSPLAWYVAYVSASMVRGLSVGLGVLAATTPTAIAKSKCGPRLGRSAGESRIVVRRVFGHSSPLLSTAAWHRARASLMAASGRPTTWVATVP